MPAPEPFYVNKWLTFSACAVLQFAAALPYTFGLFSADFKVRFGWSQSQLTGFGTAMNFGAFAAIIPGYLYSCLSGLKHGPRITLLVAATEASSGMYLVWASATGSIQLSYPAMILAGFVFANSNACIDTVALAANVANWPNDRGSAAGVMKAAVGLCPSIFGVLYVCLQLSAPSFLLLLILVPSVGCLVLLPLVNQVPWIQKCELMPHGLLTTPSRFIMTYQVLFLIAVFTTAASSLLHGQPPTALRLALLAGLLALIASVFFVAIASGGVRSRGAHVALAPEAAATAPRPAPDSVLSHPLDISDILGTLLHPSARAPRLGEVAAGSIVRVYEVDSVNSGGEVEDGDEFDEDGCAVRRPLLVAMASGALSERSDRSDTSIASSLYHEQPALDVAPCVLPCSPDFHLLFYISFAAIGAGLALLDNFPQLLCSIAPRAADGSAALPPNLDKRLLVVFSVANTLGRIAAGFAPEHALHKWGTARTFFWVLASIGTAAWVGAMLAIILLAGSPLALLPMLPLTGAAGFVFGAAVTLMSVTTSELFGLRYFAANYAVVQIAPMLATFVFPTGIVGKLYDAEAARQNPAAVGGGNLPCVGSACFASAFSILFALSLLGVLGSMLLWARTLWVYRREAAHLRDVADNIVERGSVCNSSNDTIVSGIRFELPHHLGSPQHVTQHAARW
eukprot:jgi/Ulvmu1/10949/UM007_0128.1